MTSTPPETDPNAAANEAVVTRIRRISVVSFLVMILGVGSVLAVIAFRLMTVPAAAPLMSGTVPAETGRVVSAVAADKSLTVTYQRDDGALIVIYDLRTLKETHRVTVGGPQVPRP
ncbi:MAG: hypothetical protein Q8O26_12520 [Phreatobacter sp.]|uniref:hypothetical protein n=1 Tax=Phreatobacter sp. TaxID=1966341 RepID=UPI002736B3B0|nr:hypothetical protein [Phreatobacter sp.]MDP2802697.1 hypothetical protein [Phreatobacter sp.]